MPPLPPELQSQAPQQLQPGQGPVANLGGGGQQKIEPQSLTGLQGEEQGDISGQEMLQGQGFRGVMNPAAQGDPVQEFFVEIMAMGDDAGLLDSINQEPDVESQLDEASGANDQVDMLAEIGREQMEVLVQKFMTIPPERQGEVTELFRKELSPEIYRKLEAIVRMIAGRAEQTQATGI